jgi:hypothetical protein
MTLLRKRWVWCLIGVAVGFVIGGIAGIMRAQIMFRPLVELFQMQPFGSASSSALIDLRALKKLRGGNADDAVELLETDLDGQLFWLASYEAVPADRRIQSIYNLLGRAAAYRQEYPRPPRTGTDGAAFDATMVKALSLGKKSTAGASAP